MKRRIAILLIAGALVAAACGSRGEGGSEPPPDPDGSSTTAAPGGQGGMFGTIESPCGPGDASGATDIGVTDDAITVITYDDHEAALQPGVNKGVGETMAAFEKWCNDQGGINGRPINVEFKSTVLNRYQPVVIEACTTAFAMVGGINVFDQAGAQDHVNCGLPNVPAAAVSPEQTMADLTFQPLPNPVDRYLVGPGMWIQDTYPEVVDKAAMMALKTGTTELQASRHIQAYESIGYTFVYDSEVQIGSPNLTPFVIGLRDAGAEYLAFSSTYEQLIPFQKAMADQGYKPTVFELEANYYNQNYPARAAGDAEGAFVRLTGWPAEEADENPAMAQYLEALYAAVPDAQPELLGIQSWSAALLWAQAVKELGSNVTRAGLVEKLEATTEWTGGGLHGQSNPGENIPAPCFIMMQIQGDSFVRVFPLEDADAEIYEAGNGFACNPDYNIPLPGDYAPGATIPG